MSVGPDPGAAPSVPPLESGRIPLAILVDFDGTIALTDVGDVLLAEHTPAVWEAEAAAYDAGLAGSRRLMIDEVARMPLDPDVLLATAAAQPTDPTFPAFVARARSAGIPVEVVSDGFGFFIEPALELMGVHGIPVVTARMRFDGVAPPAIEFPNGHPRCFVCGTCKRARVLAHQAAGRTVVFIGDGESDRYAAGYADIVFAKRSLVRLCLEHGWPFQRWTEFAELDAWLAATIEAWEAERVSPSGSGARPFFCGPEAWGEGLWDPPPGAFGDAPPEGR
ncbi:MAG TPA: HAD-IB family phosphatase [Candidatus Limnocylindrales bacterium]|nr:HAD-IB family phosphatase [Candidatus Limnocylindrales bacterium]